MEVSKLLEAIEGQSMKGALDFAKGVGAGKELIDSINEGLREQLRELGSASMKWGQLSTFPIDSIDVGETFRTQVRNEMALRQSGRRCGVCGNRVEG